MGDLTAAEPSPVLRLRGLLDGVERTFELPLGEYRVGSSPRSDVRLPVTGVSREHAFLKVTASGVAVTDRGSKNGTFVGSKRVDRAGVPPGTTVAFGPVKLTVEDVEPDDVELALTVDSAEDSAERLAASYLTQETPSLLGRADPSTAKYWLGCLEGLVSCLSVSPGGPAVALEFLVEALGAEGTALVEWPERTDPVVLSSAGSIGEVPPYRKLRPRLLQRSTHDPEISVSSESSGVTVCLERSGGPVLGLLIWGGVQGPKESEQLLAILLRLFAILERRVSSPSRVLAPSAEASELVFPEDYLPATSPAMTALYRQMSLLVRSDLPVLLLGETGVGKERLAAILHASSPRREGPLVAINCAAIPADLLEAELFGIDRRVATGVDPRPGRFRLAEGGTLLLDEIGEMLPSLQAKLLRVLQEKQIQPLGSPPMDVDVRIVAATNADLQLRMERGEFRRDLYFRLAGYTLEVPPLRECRDDVPSLVEHFLRLCSREASVRIRGVTVKALRRLTEHDWPGNVRELEHEIRRMVYQTDDRGTIDAGKLSANIVAARPGPASRAADVTSGDVELEPRLYEVEVRLLREALRRAKGRQNQAAKLLGISRNGLAKKLRRFGIDYRTFRT